MKRPELTYEEFCALPLTYTQGIRFNDGALRQYGNLDLGYYKEVYTPFNELYFRWGNPEVIYYLRDDDRQFDTVDQLYVAYMEKACGVTA